MAARARRRLAVAAALLLAIAAGCGAGTDDTSGAAERSSAVAGAATTTAPPGDPAPARPGDPAPVPLPPAPALPPTPDAGPEPAGLTIPALGVDAAPVRPVGVEANGEMEIPGVAEVGWYRFGARPGAPGSTVLAAHIAYDGVDGVFRHLDDLSGGDGVQVSLDDGSTSDYVVTEVRQVPKTDLPPDVWTRDGDARLTLITCGGEFDADAGHYEDNVVVVARPA